MPKQPKYSEDDLCAAFFKEVQGLYSYNQIISPDSFKIWHNDNGQRANEGAFFGFLFRKLPFLKKYEQVLYQAINYAKKIAGNRAKRLGVMKGLPDYSLLWRDSEGRPYIGYLEAKVGENTLSDEQKAFFAYCHEENINVGEFRTVTQGLKLMQQWGIIKPEVVL